MVSRRYQFVIFDLGAGISRTVIDFALAADHTIIVTTPQNVISGYACARAIFSRFKEIEDGLEKKLPNYESQRTAELKKRPLLRVSPYAKPAQSIQHMSSKFLNPDTNYLTRVKFKHPLGRLAAILSRQF